MLRWLFPVKCPFCGKILSEGVYCSACADALPRPEPERLRELAGFTGCRKALIPLSYEGTAREVLHRFKFGGKPAFAKAMAELMAEAVRPCLEELSPDGITFAPMRYSHQCRRGYNQSELLARELSSILKIPCRPMLKKTRQNRVQHGLNAVERAENVENVYRPTGDFTGRNLLLVDDVVTTGHTMAAMTRCLYEAGAHEVTCVAYATGRGIPEKR